MATTTAVSIAAGAAWTLVYTAAGTVSLKVQNRSPSKSCLIRVGASTTTSDDDDAAAEVLNPGEYRVIDLVNTDKVHARPIGNAGDVTAQGLTLVYRV